MKKAEKVLALRLIMLDKELPSLWSCLYPHDEVQIWESGPLYVIPRINSILAPCAICIHTQIFEVSVILPLLELEHFKFTPDK